MEFESRNTTERYHREESPDIYVQPRAESGIDNSVLIWVNPVDNYFSSQYDSIEWKVQHFYESCKSLEYIEADREKPLLKIINNLGGRRDKKEKFKLKSFYSQDGMC